MRRGLQRSRIGFFHVNVKLQKALRKIVRISKLPLFNFHPPHRMHKYTLALVTLKTSSLERINLFAQTAFARKILLQIFVSSVKSARLELTSIDDAQHRKRNSVSFRCLASRPSICSCIYIISCIVYSFEF